MQQVIAEFPLKVDKDPRTAAQRARLLGTLTGLSARQRTLFGRAVQEVATNSIRHAGEGRIEFRIELCDGSAFVLAAIHDSTPIVPEMQSALHAPGPDCGLRRARAAASRIDVEPTENGKVVQIRMAIPRDTVDVSETEIAEWAGILRTPRMQTALESTQRRNRALAEQLAVIQRQRQELETELQQTRSINETLTLLSLVASKTDNAVVIMNEDGLVTWVNDAFIRMTGYALPDVAGKRPDTMLAGPETSRDVLREYDQAFRLGHGVNEEWMQYRADGTTSWVTFNLTPIHDDEGCVTRWIGIGTDITKRRESQNALEAARDAAETASRLKGEFLANMSHEIRTPMNAIIGMTDLTLCTELNDDQREYMSTVKQSAESLLDLLNDILDLSRIESGRLEIEESPFEVRSTFRDALKPLGIVATQKGLDLNWEFPDDLPDWLVGDAIRLRQVLVNLVGNAIKFTNEGRVEVAVEKQWESNGQVGLQVTVSDTGIGIAPNKLDRIFDSFTQADPSITRQFGGTGLGLSISSELLRLMQGRVDVESEVGRGSRFRFSLEFRVARESDVPDAGIEAIGFDASTPTRSSREQAGLNILVADDHPANQKLIAKILEKSGHTPGFVANGHQVLSALNSMSYDVILMDVQMPELDGYQTTAAIRERERESQTHVPIIAVTAHAMQGDREKCLAAGMDAYLSKPVRARELMTLIDSLGDNQVNVSVTAATSTGYVSVDENPERDPTPTNSPGVSRSDIAVRPEFSRALERLDHDEELLIEQMQFFLKDGPGLLQLIESAFLDKDGPGLQLAAHRLKSLCATFDDEQTADTCRQLEMIGVEAGFESVTDEIAEQLQAGVNDLLERIRRYCGND